MKSQFIPIDYDYFDFQGRNFTKIIGRDEKGKRICIIDSCPIYIWAILKNKISKKRINELTNVCFEWNGRFKELESKYNALKKKVNDSRIYYAICNGQQEDG